MRHGGVEVSFGQLEESRGWGLHVYVYSLNRKGQAAHMEIDPRKCGNAKKTMDAIAAAAIVCAEHLVKKYGDVVDHQSIAQRAMELCGEELARVSHMSHTAPQKIRWLLSKQEKLNGTQQDFVKDMEHRIKNALPLTASEIHVLTVLVDYVTRKEFGQGSANGTPGLH